MGMPKTIVITGTSRGIGRFLLNHYLKKGHTVIGCSRRAMEQNIEAYEHFVLDVADEKKVQSMIRDVANKHGGIDVLINNAGIASMNHILLTPGATIEKIMATNVMGTFLFAREVAKVMIPQNFGRIVNFATVATPLKLEGEAAYAASKAAVCSLTEIMARELAPYNITVNAVGPTPIETDLIKNVPKEKMDILVDMQAIKRMGEFEDVSNVVDFFIKEESKFITGQTLYLGGVS